MLGVGQAAQGAGYIGGSSLMDNNTTFIYAGGLFAVVGLALIVFGARSKQRANNPAAA
ncbi:MAG: hypothetical protein ABSG68_26605 [Thermoguttaceae bacterium]